MTDTVLERCFFVALRKMMSMYGRKNRKNFENFFIGYKGQLLQNYNKIN